MKKIISLVIVGITVMGGVVANASTTSWVSLSRIGGAYSYTYNSYSVHRAQVRTHSSWASDYWISSSDWASPGNSVTCTAYSNCPYGEGRGENL